MPPDAFHLAVNAGHVAGLKVVLGSSIDSGWLNTQGWTALMSAVNKSYVLVVESLVLAGANVDVRVLDGATALFMTTVLGDSRIVVQLMKAGADVSVPGPRGKLERILPGLKDWMKP